MRADTDAGEFPSFFRANFAEVAASLSLALGRPELGEDAAAEAFARAYARWPAVRSYESPVGWTYRVGLNHGLRTAKRLGREAALLERAAGPSTSTDVPTDVDFWVLLRSLPERQRIAAALRYGADLTETQIAQIMRVRRSTVSSALEAARTKLGRMAYVMMPAELGATESVPDPTMESSS
jgi:RNA polymerase sigma-70 factor (ECF subfamily)